MNATKRYAIYKILRRANPNPVTELRFTTPFELLVAVILSAQATDKSVNLATQRLFGIANTPQALLDLGEEKLKEYIKTIGLFRTKARYIMATCQLLLAHHHGTVPADRAALESLPGVGRKTANVVLNTAFGQPAIAVDTHIFRVAQRIGLAQGSTPLEIEKQLTTLIPKKYLQNAHHWLILHGRYTCTARKPKCANCLIRDLCEYPDKTAG